MCNPPVGIHAPWKFWNKVSEFGRLVCLICVADDVRRNKISAIDHFKCFILKCTWCRSYFSLGNVKLTLNDQYLSKLKDSKVLLGSGLPEGMSSNCFASQRATLTCTPHSKLIPASLQLFDNLINMSDPNMPNEPSWHQCTSILINVSMDRFQQSKYDDDITGAVSNVPD